jgi:tRNA-dihydrouridine synthase
MPANQELATLKEYLQNPSSKVQTVLISEYVLENPYLIAPLYHLIHSDKPKIQWHAAWVFEHIFIAKPEIIKPYLKEIVSEFHTIENNSVKRHFAKILSLTDINNMANGIFINTCFEWLKSELISVAVKAHCMQILFHLTLKYPDLKPELRIVLEEQIPFNSAGFKSRAQKILKQL